MSTMTIARPEAEESLAYYHRYIARVSDEPLGEQLTGQLRDIEQLFETVTDRDALARYAEGKWSIKEILGHLSDTERIFTYRLLRIARGDATPLSARSWRKPSSGGPVRRATPSHAVGGASGGAPQHGSIAGRPAGRSVDPMGGGEWKSHHGARARLHHRGSCSASPRRPEGTLRIGVKGLCCLRYLTARV